MNDYENVSNIRTHLLTEIMSLWTRKIDGNVRHYFFISCVQVNINGHYAQMPRMTAVMP